MSWQDDLAQLEEQLREGTIDAAQYRKRREDVLDGVAPEAKQGVAAPAKRAGVPEHSATPVPFELPVDRLPPLDGPPDLAPVAGAVPELPEQSAPPAESPIPTTAPEPSVKAPALAPETLALPRAPERSGPPNITGQAKSPPGGADLPAIIGDSPLPPEPIWVDRIEPRGTARAATSTASRRGRRLRIPARPGPLLVLLLVVAVVSGGVYAAARSTTATGTPESRVEPTAIPVRPPGQRASTAPSIATRRSPAGRMLHDLNTRLPRLPGISHGEPVLAGASVLSPPPFYGATEAEALHRAHTATLISAASSDGARLYRVVVAPSDNPIRTLKASQRSMIAAHASVIVRAAVTDEISRYSLTRSGKRLERAVFAWRHCVVAVQLTEPVTASPAVARRGFESVLRSVSAALPPKSAG